MSLRIFALCLVVSGLAACGDGGLYPGEGEAAPQRPLTCSIFPPDNAWNTDVSAFPVDPESDQYIERLSSTWRLQFVPNLPINSIDSGLDGVPFVTITYDNAGDPGPMPIPADALYHVKDPTKLVTEDNHLVLVDNADCRLYELWSVSGPDTDGGWTVGSGAIFNLTSNALRPDHAASSSASGLPVFAGAVRASEVRAGAITHALSFPATLTQEGFVRPATNWQPDAVYLTKLPLACALPTFGFPNLCAEVLGGTFVYDHPNNAPMGLRIRLKAAFDLLPFSGEARIILEAAKSYGLIVSDGSGTTGLIRGEKVRDPDAWDWSTSINAQLIQVPASAFEVVATGPILP